MAPTPRAGGMGPEGRLCEACPSDSGTPAVRLIFARNFPDGYAVCARHGQGGRGRRGRYVPSDWRSWPGLDDETRALARARGPPAAGPRDGSEKRRDTTKTERQ